MRQGYRLLFVVNTVSTLVNLARRMCPLWCPLQLIHFVCRVPIYSTAHGGTASGRRGGRIASIRIEHRTIPPAFGGSLGSQKISGGLLEGDLSRAHVIVHRENVVVSRPQLEVALALGAPRSRASRLMCRVRLMMVSIRL